MHCMMMYCMMEAMLEGSRRGWESWGPRARCRPHPDPSSETMAQAVEEFLQSLPEAVQQRLQEVKGLHGQYEELEQEYTKEIEQIEAKYAALYRELARAAPMVENSDQGSRTD